MPIHLKLYKYTKVSRDNGLALQYPTKFGAINHVIRQFLQVLTTKEHFFLIASITH